jgi:hypothetical protein
MCSNVTGLGDPLAVAPDRPILNAPHSHNAPFSTDAQSVILYVVHTVSREFLMYSRCRRMYEMGLLLIPVGKAAAAAVEC